MSIEDEKAHSRLLVKLHAGRLAEAQIPQNFARGIMAMRDDILADLNVDAKTEFGGEKG